MAARKSPALATVGSSGAYEDDVLRFDDAPEFMESAPLEDMDLKVKEAQEQLLQLRMQQEEIERQKQHLETLRIKQERFMAGKKELIEKLSRSVSGVERELYDAQKRVEELSITHDDFRRHLDILKSLQPERWHRTQVDTELDNALAAIEDAEADFSKGQRRLESMRVVEAAAPLPSLLHPAASSAPAESTSEAQMHYANVSEELIVWLRRGFAFTLPLIGAMLIGLLLAKLMF
jgi:vacuolar-type H+-ATPase subunit I/STV1